MMDTIPSPNGIAFSPDASTLYLAVTRANAVWRIVLAEDGSIERAATFIQLSGGDGPDGLAIDEAGNLAVCTR